MPDLTEQYFRQEKWRHWDQALDCLPWGEGLTVFDFGCGTGDVAGRLNRMGFNVKGFDINSELLAAARTRHVGVSFNQADLQAMDPRLVGTADGIWSSFVPAYFLDFESILRRWRNCLNIGGWLALVEVDDLMGHRPLPEPFRVDICRLYDEAARMGRYDFLSGRKLADAAAGAGFDVLRVDTLPDDEIVMEGPLGLDVLDAWNGQT